MNIEGRLQFRLTLADGGVRGVEIVSSRPVHASRAFQGKLLPESLKMLPLLFSICGIAQSCAGVRAGEQALGLRVAASVERLREALVDLESLREHLWRICIDWPGFIGSEVDKQALVEMAAIERDYRRLVCPGGDPMRLGGADCRPQSEALGETVERLAALLRQHVFDMPPVDWLALPDRSAFEDWLSSAQGAATGLLRWVRQNGWSDAGHCESAPLPSLDEAHLHEALQEDEFIARPQWSGHCCETGSLTRVRTPLLDDLQQVYGKGLLVRLVARLSEIAWLSDRLLPEPEGDSGDSDAPFAINSGIGQVVAARGHLVHRVSLQGETIGRYQILAPTEWNFHPQGVAATALAGLRGDRTAVEQQARLLINAIDPCVGYTLDLVEE